MSAVQIDGNNRAQMHCKTQIRMQVVRSYLADGKMLKSLGFLVYKRIVNFF